MISNGTNNYAALLSDLHNIFKNQIENNTAIRNVANRLELFGAEGLTLFLQDLLLDESKLKEIASRSYLHGNGFYKIILESNNFFKLRIHIWEAENPAEENIHNHRWNLASTIITGTLKSEIWEYSTEEGIGEELDEYLYVGKTKNADPYHQYTGKVKVNVKHNTSYDVGKSYFLTPETMHRVLHEGTEKVCTLMCQTTRKSNRSARTIIKRKNIPIENHKVINECLSSQELKDVFNKLLINILEKI